MSAQGINYEMSVGNFLQSSSYGGYFKQNLNEQKARAEDLELADLTHDDFEIVMELWNESNLNYVDLSEEANFRRFISVNTGLSKAAYVNGNLAGVVLCGWDGLYAHLYHVAVCSSTRRMGIGRQLVASVMGELREREIAYCRLFVLNNNKLGRKFWFSLGFVPQAHKSAFVSDVGLKAA